MEEQLGSPACDVCLLPWTGLRYHSGCTSTSCRCIKAQHLTEAPLNCSAVTTQACVACRDISWLGALLRALVFRSAGGGLPAASTERVWAFVLLLATLVRKEWLMRRQEAVPPDRNYDPPYPLSKLSIGAGFSFGDDKHGYVP